MSSAATEVPQPRWRLGEPGRRWFDRLLVLALLAPVAAFPVLGLFPVEAALALAQLVPLLWRRDHAVAAFVAVAAASALQAAVVDTPLWSQVAFPVATYSVARYAGSRWAAAVLGVGLCASGVAAYDWLGGFGGDVNAQALLSYVLTIATIVVAAWALGTTGRVRQAYVDTLVERGHRLALEAAQQAELAAADERARIAREMHDVVAHGLSVIVVQADGARYAAAHDPGVATTTLETIAETGRQSLTEMRRMLGVLRTGAEPTGTRPQPRLADLGELVEDARANGLPVEATLPDPSLPVPGGVALSAYRIVQEALTNVRKHAGPGAAATVRVVLEGSALSVLVADDGRGAAAVDDGHGLGLLGMRERVAAHGGELDAGPRPGGGFEVAARIPL